MSAPWASAAAKLADGSLADFGATCYYTAEALTDALARDITDDDGSGAAAVPLGMVQVAYGGTMVEQWEIGLWWQPKELVVLVTARPSRR